MPSMRPIYTAFFTVGTLYEHEAVRLRQSLERHGLEHDIQGVPDLGSWQENARQTAHHIQRMMREHAHRPIVQLDADAVVWKYPVLFDLLLPEKVDLAVHYRAGKELLNGTLWIAPTEPARQVIQKYVDLVDRDPRNCHNEQRMLQAAIDELRDFIKLEKLPAGYCWIHDIMKEDLSAGEEVVIEHLQASREAHPSELTKNRHERLREIDGYAFSVK